MYSFFMGTAIPSLYHGSAKKYERQFGTCAFQVRARVRVYLIQNNVFEVDSTKNHIFIASYNNYVKRASNTCSVGTRVSVLAIYGLT